MIAQPMNAISFMSGFVYGSNLTGNGEEMTRCNSYVENNINAKVSSMMYSASNITINNTFDGLYAFYNILYVAHPTVTSCSLYASEGTSTLKNNFVNILDLGKLMDNFIHNLMTAYDDYQ